MSEYVVGGSSVTSLTVLAGTLALKLVRIEWTPTTNAFPATINRYAGAGLSGGSAATISALRQGAPTASSTAKTGATVSGTSSFLHQDYGATASVSSYTPPSSVMIAPGAAVSIAIASGNFSSVIITFDEQRLQGGF